jgi:hypothetical protein
MSVDNSALADGPQREGFIAHDFSRLDHRLTDDHGYAGTNEARMFAPPRLALTAEHRVNGALFEEARQTFKERGVLDLIILAGCYDLVSSLLNAFEIPKPT